MARARSPSAATSGVRQGVIQAVGNVEGTGTQEVDASGLAVAPGFIDIHTHFDPQLCWDAYATPSIEHGITTVVIGNCSLSLAPIQDRSGADKIVSMFGVIEDIKKQTFDEAVPFTWHSFPEYLEHIRPNLGINVGALIRPFGTAPLRYGRGEPGTGGNGRGNRSHVRAGRRSDGGRRARHFQFVRRYR